MGTNERDWVVQPDTAHIDVAIGNEARISPELREALEQLAAVLAKDEEVTGHMYTTVECGKVRTEPCAVNMICGFVTIIS